MTTTPCPSDFALEALILDELSARQADVAEHVTACAVCRAKVAAKRKDDAEFAASAEAASIRRALTAAQSPRAGEAGPSKDGARSSSRRLVVAALSFAAAIALGFIAWRRPARDLAAVPSPAASPAAPSEEAEVLRVQREWMEAIRDNDVAALDRLLTDDYTYTDSRGGVTGKADSLRQARSTANRMKAFQTLDAKAQVHGDTAVVTGRLRVEGETEGKAYEAEVRFTDILARIDGRWRAVAAHASRLPDRRSP